MNDVETYLNRLVAMRDRLRKLIDDEVEDIREVIHKPGEGVNIHTHNADMDVEGLDNAVGVGHALVHRLQTVETMLSRLRAEGESYLAGHRDRLDAYLDTEDFAERLRDGTTGDDANSDDASL